MPKEVSAPPYKGSYGTIFYGKDGSTEVYGKRKEADFVALEARIYEQSIRDQIPPPHPAEWDAYVQTRGKLLLQSTESPMVVKSLLGEVYTKANPVFSSSVGAHGEEDKQATKSGFAKYLNRRRVTDDEEEDKDEEDATKAFPSSQGPLYLEPTKLSAAKVYSPPKRTALEQHNASLLQGKDGWNNGTGMRAQKALHLLDRSEVGPYHVPLVQTEWTAPLLAEKVASGHAFTTPKTWPAASQYPSSSAKAAAAEAEREEAAAAARRRKGAARQSHNQHPDSDILSVLSEGSSVGGKGRGQGRSSHGKSVQVYPHPAEEEGSVMSAMTGGPSQLSSLQATLFSSGAISLQGVPGGKDSHASSSPHEARAGPAARQKLRQAAALKGEVSRMKAHGVWLQNNASRPPLRAASEASAPASSTGSLQADEASLSASSHSTRRSNLTLTSVLDSLYSGPYDAALAGKSYSERVALQQQQQLEQGTDKATKALAAYKGTRRASGAGAGGRAGDPRSLDSANDEGEDDFDPYEKPAWRNKKNKARLAAPGPEEEGDHLGGAAAAAAGEGKRRSGKKGSMPLHPSLGAPLSEGQLVNLKGDDGTVSSTTYSRTNHKRHGQMLAEHLDTVTNTAGATGGLVGSVSVPRNPFRPSRQREMAVSARASKPPNPLDPLEYKQSMTVRRPAPRGSMAIVIRPEKTLNFAVPAEDEVHDALAKVTRRSILAYDTRIVETGAVAKALQNPANPSPGLAAIIDLHQAFIAAAALNPNPWQLKREQVYSVLMTKLFWLEPEVCRRLCSAYDSTSSGVIRFVRISVSLMCCINPGLATLITTLERLGEEREAKAKAQREREEMRKTLMHQTSSSSTAASSGITEKGKGANKDKDKDKEGKGQKSTLLQRQQEDAAQREADRQHAAELFLVKLLHALYEDCEGSVAAQVYSNTHPHTLGKDRALASPHGMGMRLQDVVEALSCCAASIEDELSIATVLKPLVQGLFRQGQAKDDVINHVPDEAEDGAEAGAASGVEWDEASLGSAGGSLQTMSSSFTARSGFTPKSAPNPASASGPGAARGSHLTQGQQGQGGSSLSLGAATAQGRDKLEQQAKRAADRWRLQRGLGRDGVALGRGGAVTDGLVDYQNSLAFSSSFTNGGGGGGGSVLRAGGESVAWEEESVGSLASLSTRGSLAGSGAGRGARTSSRLNSSKGKTTAFGAHDSLDNSSLRGSRASASRLHPVDLLGHQSLRSSRQIPRVTQGELISALLDHPAALSEFVRQLKRFRGLCFPNLLHGSVTYMETVGHGGDVSVPYGTKQRD